MDIFDLVLRWAHVFSAVALAGGIFFWQWVWLPAHRELTTEEREESFGRLRKTWARIVMLTSLLLLVSGLVNAIRTITAYQLPGSYHALVALKLLLGLVLMFLAARLSGRSQAAVQLRSSLPFWMMVSTGLAVVLVGVAGVMKVTPRIEKATVIEPAVVVPIEDAS